MAPKKIKNYRIPISEGYLKFIPPVRLNGTEDVKAQLLSLHSIRDASVLSDRFLKAASVQTDAVNRYKKWAADNNKFALNGESKCTIYDLEEGFCDRFKQMNIPKICSVAMTALIQAIDTTAFQAIQLNSGILLEERKKKVDELRKAIYSSLTGKALVGPIGLRKQSPQATLTVSQSEYPNLEFLLHNRALGMFQESGLFPSRCDNNFQKQAELLQAGKYVGHTVDLLAPFSLTREPAKMNMGLFALQDGRTNFAAHQLMTTFNYASSLNTSIQNLKARKDSLKDISTFEYFIEAIKEKLGDGYLTYDANSQAGLQHYLNILEDSIALYSPNIDLEAVSENIEDFRNILKDSTLNQATGVVKDKVFKNERLVEIKREMQFQDHESSRFVTDSEIEKLTDALFSKTASTSKEFTAFDALRLANAVHTSPVFMVNKDMTRAGIEAQTALINDRNADLMEVVKKHRLSWLPGAFEEAYGKVLGENLNPPGIYKYAAQSELAKVFSHSASLGHYLHDALSSSSTVITGPFTPEAEIIIEREKMKADEHGCESIDFTQVESQMAQYQKDLDMALSKWLSDEEINVLFKAIENYNKEHEGELYFTETYNGSALVEQDDSKDINRSYPLFASMGPHSTFDSLFLARGIYNEFKSKEMDKFRTSAWLDPGIFKATPENIRALQMVVDGLNVIMIGQIPLKDFAPEIHKIMHSNPVSCSFLINFAFAKLSGSSNKPYNGGSVAVHFENEFNQDAYTQFLSAVTGQARVTRFSLALSFFNKYASQLADLGYKGLVFKVVDNHVVGLKMPAFKDTDTNRLHPALDAKLSLCKAFGDVLDDVPQVPSDLITNTETESVDHETFGESDKIFYHVTAVNAVINARKESTGFCEAPGVSGAIEDEIVNAYEIYKHVMIGERKDKEVETMMTDGTALDITQHYGLDKHAEHKLAYLNSLKKKASGDKEEDAIRDRFARYASGWSSGLANAGETYLFTPEYCIDGKRPYDVHSCRLSFQTETQRVMPFADRYNRPTYGKDPSHYSTVILTSRFVDCLRNIEHSEYGVEDKEGLYGEINELIAKAVATEDVGLMYKEGFTNPLDGTELTDGFEGKNRSLLILLGRHFENTLTEKLAELLVTVGFTHSRPNRVIDEYIDWKNRSVKVKKVLDRFSPAKKLSSDLIIEWGLLPRVRRFNERDFFSSAKFVMWLDAVGNGNLDAVKELYDEVRKNQESK